MTASEWILRDPTLGDLTLDDYSGMLVAAYDLAFPSARVVTDPIPGGDGEDDLTEYHGGRLLQLDVRLVGSAADRQRAAMTLRQWSHPRRRIDVRWTSEAFGTLVAHGAAPRPFVGAVPGAMRAMVARLVWFVPSGVFVSDVERTAEVTAGALSITGRVYDLTFDRVYPAASGSPGSATVNVGGTTDSWPILRAYGPVTNPVIEIDETGGYWAFTANGGLAVVAGDYLEIDVRNGSARVNGLPASSALNKLDYSTSSWQPLAPGNNTVRFNGTGTSTSSVLVATYRDTYL